MKFKNKLLITSIFIFFSSVYLYSYDTQDLVDMMKSSSYDLKIERIKLKEAYEDKQKALSDVLPTIKYNARGYYIANPVDKINISLDDIASTIAFPPGVNVLTPGTYIPVFSGMENTYYSFSLTLTQPLVTWGKLTMQNRIYSTLAEIQKDNVSLTEKKLEAEIRTRADSFYYMTAIKDTLTDFNVAVNEINDFIKQTTNNSMTSTSILLNSQNAVKEVDLSLTKINKEIRSMCLNLGYLVGKNELSEKDLNITPITKTEIEKFLSDYSEMSMISLATSQNKEAISMREKAIGISENKRYIAMASLPYAPDISLIGTLSYSGPRFPLIEKGWSSKDDWNALIGINIQGTLFDGTKQYANVRQADDNIQRAKEEKKQTVETIRKTVIQTREELVISLQDISFRESLIDEKNENFRIAQERYNSGQISKVDYLKSEIEVYAAIIDYYRACISASTLYYTLCLLVC